MFTKTNMESLETMVWLNCTPLQAKYTPPDYVIKAVESCIGSDRVALTATMSGKYGKFKDAVLFVLHIDDTVDLWVGQDESAITSIIQFYKDNDYGRYVELDLPEKICDPLITFQVYKLMQDCTVAMTPDIKVEVDCGDDDDATQVVDEIINKNTTNKDTTSKDTTSKIEEEIHRQLAQLDERLNNKKEGSGDSGVGILEIRQAIDSLVGDKSITWNRVNELMKIAHGTRKQFYYCEVTGCWWWGDVGNFPDNQYNNGPFSSFLPCIYDAIKFLVDEEGNFLVQDKFKQDFSDKEPSAYIPGTKSYVLNKIHCELQELQNNPDYDIDFDELFAAIESVRDMDTSTPHLPAGTRVKLRIDLSDEETGAGYFPAGTTGTLQVHWRTGEDNRVFIPDESNDGYGFYVTAESYEKIDS